MKADIRLVLMVIALLAGVCFVDLLYLSAWPMVFESPAIQDWIATPIPWGR
jgi:hypothetical protein